MADRWLKRGIAILVDSKAQITKKDEPKKDEPKKDEKDSENKDQNPAANLANEKKGTDNTSENDL